MNEKIYCGKAKQTQYNYKINICLSDIPEEFITESNANGKRYARLELKESRQPDERGNTHYLQVDTWKPDGTRKQSKFAKNDSCDDIPF